MSNQNHQELYSSLDNLQVSIHELRSKLTILLLRIDDDDTLTAEEARCLQHLCESLGNEITAMKKKGSLLERAFKKIEKHADKIEKEWALTQSSNKGS